jgi:hypothetical protein
MDEDPREIDRTLGRGMRAVVGQSFAMAEDLKSVAPIGRDPQSALKEAPGVGRGGRDVNVVPDFKDSADAGTHGGRVGVGTPRLIRLIADKETDRRPDVSSTGSTEDGGHRIREAITEPIGVMIEGEACP